MPSKSFLKACEVSDWIFLPDEDFSLPSAVEDFQFSATRLEDWPVSRSSSGYGRGPDGRWKLFAANVQRTYFHPVTLQDLGILVEPESYQTVYSPRNVNLQLLGTTRAELPDALCPFGTGVFRLSATTANTPHGFNLVSGVGVAEPIGENTEATGQFIFKPDGINAFRMYCQKRDGALSYADFVMTGEGTASNLVGCVASIERDTDGFYRMGMTVSSGSGTTPLKFGAELALDSGIRTFAGNAAQGVQVAYFGIERGSVLTSPSTAAGTSSTLRAADVITSTPDWMGSGAKSFGVEFTPLTSSPTTVFELGSQDTMKLRVEGGVVRYDATTGGQTVAFLSGPTAPPGVPRRVVVTAGTNAFTLGHEGSILGVDKDGAAPAAMTTMRIGGQATTFAPLALKRIKFWNEALSENATIAYSKDLSLNGTVIEAARIEVQPSISVPPEETTITFVVALSRPELTASVDYRLVNGTAVSGRDFIAGSGTLTFGFGETVQEVSVSLGARPPEDRSFRFVLSNPKNVILDNAACEVTLLGKPAVTPQTTLDVLFGQGIGSQWSLVRSTSAPYRNSAGVWGMVPANSPAQVYLSPTVNGVENVGIIVDAIGYDQRLLESVAPPTLTATTSQFDLTTQTPTGTRSVIISETATTETHGIAGDFVEPFAISPLGDFTFWIVLRVEGGRTIWQLSTKGRDNIWADLRFDLSGNGSIIGTPNASFAVIEKDAFFPGYFRVGLGRVQSLDAGVPASFTLWATDAGGSPVIAGSTANGLRIAHMQLEGRLGWGSPITVSGASAVTVRAPDDLRPSGDWFKKSAYSIGVLGSRLLDVPTTQRIVHIRDATPHADDYGFYIQNGVVGAPNTTGSAYNGMMTGAPTTIGSPFTVILTSDPTSRFALFQGGVKCSEISLVGRVAPRLANTMRIAARLDGADLQQAAFVLQRIRYWDTPLTDAEGVHFSANLAAGPLPVPVVPPVVSVPASFRISEGGVVTVPIIKTGPGECAVTYTTKAGTATFGADYVGFGPLVASFATNETQKEFPVQTVADTIAEGAHSFTFEISAPTGCTLGNSVCTITIVDPPVVSIPATANVKEGTAATIMVVKSGEGPCSVSWQTEAVSASWNVDYQGVDPTTISFGATETSKTITVTSLPDTEPDPNEVFNIKLSNPVGCTISGTGVCAVTITDDDTAVATLYKRSVTFGGRVNGGIGKPVYYVTNLKDDNTNGTLRYGINLGGRHIVFTVGGVIQMTQDWGFTKSDVYVSGETAPYPGITLRGSASGGGNLQPGASKRITFSHINFERCYDARIVSNSNGDAVELSPGPNLQAEDIEFRHCSFFWSNDEVVSVWATGKDATRGTCRRISFTDCLFAEPLRNPQDLGYRAHYENNKIEPNHNYGFIFGVRSYDCDIQYSMFTDCGMRGPFMDADTSIVLGNNIALNCNKGAHVTINRYDTTLKPYKIMIAGYLAISGPDSTASDYQAFKIHSEGGYMHPAGSIVWADGLYGLKGPSGVVDPKPYPIRVNDETNQRFVIADITKVARPIDIPGSPIVIMSAADMRQRAIDNIGPFPKNRIPNLKRKIEHLKGNTGALVNHETQKGVDGPSSFAQTNRALDGNTKFSDNTTIPAYPVPNGSTLAADIKKVRDWLELFLSRIQYD